MKLLPTVDPSREHRKTNTMGKSLASGKKSTNTLSDLLNMASGPLAIHKGLDSETLRENTTRLVDEVHTFESSPLNTIKETPHGTVDGRVAPEGKREDARIHRSDLVPGKVAASINLKGRTSKTSADGEDHETASLNAKDVNGRIDL